MIKSEAKFQTLFNHWLKAGRLKGTYGAIAFELKHTRGKDSLPFSAVEDHQLDALVAVTTTRGLIYKISDESRGFKPFDCFMMWECQAFIVIKYPYFFVLITVDEFIQEKKRSKVKSLTDERAKEIAFCIEKLK